MRFSKVFFKEKGGCFADGVTTSNITLQVKSKSHISNNDQNVPTAIENLQGHVYPFAYY